MGRSINFVTYSNVFFNGTLFEKKLTFFLANTFKLLVLSDQEELDRVL